MKILFLQKRLLCPADTGGKIRTLNIIRYLAQWHEVVYLCNIQKEEELHTASMLRLGVQLHTVPWKEAPRESWRFYAGLAKNLLSRHPFAANKDFDPQLFAKAKKIATQQHFDLLICDFIQMALNVPNIDGLPTLLFQHNVEAEVYRRMADGEENSLKRAYIRIQQRKMEQYERREGRRFDRVIAVSKRDRDTFVHRYGWPVVDVISTGVDLSYFQPRADPRKRGRLVFVGSMDWIPNQQGVIRFAEKILPLIRKTRPDATLNVVGRSPPAAIENLGDYPGVTVCGTVDDVRPYMAEAEVAVVPLYAGGGTRLKIFEFMAMKTPVVSTAIGAEGLDIAPGLHFAEADGDHEFAQAVLSILNRPTEQTKISTNAFETVTSRFGSEKVAREFEKTCLEMTENEKFGI